MGVNSASLINNSDTLVVKIGSATLIDPKTGIPRLEWLQSLADDIKTLQDNGKKVLVVTSGAVALGRAALKIPFDKASKLIPTDEKQAAAAIGQIRLSQIYQNAFHALGVEVAQLLLTPNDTKENPEGTNQHAFDTLNVLMRNNIIPIINENDSTATEEIKFGDNDRLAALITAMVGANSLVILSTTDGLYTDDPRTNACAQHIPLVENFSAVNGYAKDADSGISTGGMLSKMQAAEIAHKSGANVIITDGASFNPILGLLNGDLRSTIIPAKSIFAESEPCEQTIAPIALRK